MEGIFSLCSLLFFLLSKSCLAHKYEFSLPAPCPCERKSLCKALTLPPRQERFFISSTTKNWKYYDFSKMTTISLFGEWDPQVMCHAHAMNIRVVFIAGLSISRMHDAKYRQQWAMNITLLSLSRFADGINLDIEEGVSPGSQRAKDVTLFSRDVSQIMRKNIPGVQISFDVFYTSDCKITGQCYEFANIAKEVDFLAIECYDQWNMLKGPCHGGPNCGYQRFVKGVNSYNELGVKPSQLIPLLPWYGYNYPCLSFSNGTCYIKKIPFGGGECSDASGHQEGFSLISLRLEHSMSGKHFDKKRIAPFFEYVDARDKMVHQIWYDDYISLPPKYQYGLDKLRGIGIFHMDCCYYGTNKTRMKETYKMWEAVPKKLL